MHRTRRAGGVDSVHRMPFARSRVCRVLTAALLLAPSLAAQEPTAAAAPDSGAAPRVDARSPRAAIGGYLGAMRGRDPAAAARWLELPPGASTERGAELAERLDAVLARHVRLDLGALSPEAEGDPADAADPRREIVGVIPGPAGVADTVALVRTRGRDGDPAWRFDAVTVARVDGWYDRLPNPWIRERLPAPLLAEGPLGVQWWQWLALLLVPLAAAIGGWALARPLGIVVRRVVSRTDAEWDDRVVERLTGPVRLGIASLVAVPLVRLLGLPLGVEATTLGLARAVGLLALFWALLRATRLLERSLERGTWGSTAQGRSLVPLLGRVLRLALFAIGVVVALSQLGYPVGTLLAGLGLGGIAIAFAAQKTIENFFGSLSLAADRAFRVGDWVTVDGISGSVEQIGLRSTAIRTLGRSVVRIPNGKLADMRIENFGLRDRFVLDVTVPLAAGTTMAQLERIMAAWEATLRGHPGLFAESGTTVRLTGFVDGAPQVLVQAWFDTTDVGRFREWQQGVLTAFHDAVAREGTQLAAPVRRVELAVESRGDPVGADGARGDGQRAPATNA